MVKIYTAAFILQYLYNDLNENQKALFEIEMQQNKFLYEKVNKIKSLINQLNDFCYEPSQTSVDIVLEYSMKLNKQKELAD